MTRNLARLTNAANRIQAWHDWNALAEKARKIGLSDATIEQLAPPAGAGWRKIDRHIAKLRDAIASYQVEMADQINEWH